MEKDIYVAPQVQVLEMEVGGPVMDGTVGKPSDYPNGGNGFEF